MKKTCLNCAHLSEGDGVFRPRRCLFEVVLPKCDDKPFRGKINVKDPFENCPCWEEKK